MTQAAKGRERGAKKAYMRSLDGRRKMGRAPYFNRMFLNWPMAGSRMLKATQPRAGTSSVATSAALLSFVALTTVSAAWTRESSACAEPATNSVVAAAPKEAKCCALCRQSRPHHPLSMTYYMEEGKGHQVDLEAS